MPNLLIKFFLIINKYITFKFKISKFFSLLIVPSKSEAPSFPILIKNCSIKIFPFLNCIRDSIDFTKVIF